LVAGVVGVTHVSNGARTTGKETAIIQANDIILNGTDYNVTIDQIPPNLNITIAPRIITEYADLATTNNVESGVPSFQISPRIIFEYADYATLVVPQSYAGITLGMEIGSPVVSPLGAVLLNQSKTISFNVTSSLGLLKNVTVFFRTTLNQTWQVAIPHNLTYTLADHVNSTTAQFVIPGQSQPCNVSYEIEAYSYPYTIDNVTNNQGDYLINDNAGQYYVYNVAIPEFPSVLILPLLMIVTLLSAIIYKKRARPSDK
jgi:hypothetical protein